MRFILTIILFATTFFLKGQPFSDGSNKHKEDFMNMVLGKYHVSINSCNEQNYLDTINKLIEFNNNDSSYKATKLMWGMWFYDTTKYSVTFFKPLITKILKSRQEYYKENLEGKWRFSHDFWTGLVFQSTTTTAEDTNKTVLFKNGIAEFYFKDSLLRRTGYKVFLEISGFELSWNSYFKIQFLDKNDYWVFNISPSKTSPVDELKLTVILDPNCSCGCGSLIYKKENREVYSKRIITNAQQQHCTQTGLTEAQSASTHYQSSANRLDR